MPTAQTIPSGTRRDRAVAFFHKHGGFSYDPKTETPDQGRLRCANAMADAEQYAWDQDWTFEVSPDPYADESFMDNQPEQCQAEWRGKAQAVLLRDADGEVLQSIGGCFGDADYIRVIKAELALEAMPN
jgi:hypothetical protein